MTVNKSGMCVCAGGVFLLFAIVLSIVRAVQLSVKHEEYKPSMSSNNLSEVAKVTEAAKATTLAELGFTSGEGSTIGVLACVCFVLGGALIVFPLANLFVHKTRNSRTRETRVSRQY